MKITLNEFFLALIAEKPFYGRLASSLQRVVKPGLGTMAVGIHDGRATFFYDPEFLEPISFKAAMFAIEHEMLHLVLDHIPRYLELLASCREETERRKAGAVSNIAMDASINTMLREHKGFNEAQAFLRERIKLKNPDMLPEIQEDARNGMILPENFDLPIEGSFEFYQWSLMKKVKIHEIACQLVGATTHELWTEAEGKDGQGKPGDGQSFSGMSPDELLSTVNQIREQAKETLRSVVRAMGGYGRGTMPNGIEEWLETYLAAPIIPWWEIFSTRARMSRVSKYRRSVTVPNRALLALSEEDPRIIPAPGRVRDKAWRIFLYVDTSGSMSTESLEIVMSELEYMLSVDENMEIRYMQGDATTHLDVVLHTGDKIPRQMMGRGGTDFDAYFSHMRQYVHDDNKTPDLVVVYTDGYAPAVSHENRLPSEIPVVWLVTPGHDARFHEGYGEIILCDPEHNEKYKA